jgi:osmotically-inducible protein OsmY
MRLDGAQMQVPLEQSHKDMNDKEIRQNIIDELDFEPIVDAANIGVAVNNGVATLSGHVPSYLQKVAAERAVWRVKGVTGLAQEITVRLTPDGKWSDEEIAERALRLLSWSTLIPKDAVRVKVTDGWITLSGQVDWNFQRQAAESEVHKLSGVTGITNDIKLVPEVEASDIRSRITDALKRHAEVEAARIHIEVHGDKVAISGEVDDWSERQAVKRAVWSTSGVRSVEDNLRIG